MSLRSKFKMKKTTMSKSYNKYKKNTPHRKLIKIR